MLKQRIITALILLPIMLGMLFWASDILWAAFSALIALLALWEYARMAGIDSKDRAPYLLASAVFMLLAVAGGWALLRMSLHDPNMPLNIEADREGRADEIERRVKELLTGFDALDRSGFRV